MVKRNSQNFFSLRKPQASNLEKNLKNLLKTFSADELKKSELTDLIISKYSEEHRFYHNLSHVWALLQNAEKLKDKFADYESVQLAVWFHDLIYEPKSLKNEIESAQLAVSCLTELAVPAGKIKKIENIILATQKHEASGLDSDGKLFLDLDLGILGAKEEIYNRYSRAIRAEYSFAPENLYRDKRRMVLQSFLQREYIYYTDEGREMFEQQARLNITKEIKELS